MIPLFLHSLVTEVVIRGGLPVPFEEVVLCRKSLFLYLVGIAKNVKIYV